MAEREARYGPVETAVRRQLRSERIVLGEWALATAVVQLARRLDGEADTGRYARAMLALDRTLDRLLDLAGNRRPGAALPDAPAAGEEKPPPDAVDELAVKRDRSVS